MKIAGENTVNHPIGAVWDAVLDPQVLVQAIPGCERLETIGENTYAMTVTAGVASIKGTYDGTCSLYDLVERESLTMKLTGAGAPGTVDAIVNVKFTDLGEQGTTIGYEADATVGGMVGGVGQRMLTSVSKRMAGEFFGNIGKVISAPAGASGAAPAATGDQSTSPAVDGAPAAAAQPGVFTPPAKSGGAIGSSDDFAKGLVAGAGLMLIGVVVGAIFGRRR